MAIPRILVVDDDLETRRMLTQYLQRNGAIALPASNEAEIRKQFESGRIDMILLDVMLGDENGLDICARLRQEQEVPIIMVSALSADHQRMQGYEVGADDYIKKPFNPALLLARIKAVLARTQRAASLAHRRRTNSFHFEGWTYDAKRDEVRSPEGFQVALSRRENALLQAFLANARIPLTREEIVAALDVTGEEVVGENQGRAIDVLVGRLRSKIEKNPKDPRMIKTERGVGYVFAVDVTVEQQ